MIKGFFLMLFFYVKVTTCQETTVGTRYYLEHFHDDHGNLTIPVTKDVSGLFNATVYLRVNGNVVGNDAMGYYRSCVKNLKGSNPVLETVNFVESNHNVTLENTTLDLIENEFNKACNLTFSIISAFSSLDLQTSPLVINFNINIDKEVNGEELTKIIDLHYNVKERSSLPYSFEITKKVENTQITQKFLIKTVVSKVNQEPTPESESKSEDVTESLTEETTFNPVTIGEETTNPAKTSTEKLTTLAEETDKSTESVTDVTTVEPVALTEESASTDEANTSTENTI